MSFCLKFWLLCLKLYQLQASNLSLFLWHPQVRHLILSCHLPPHSDCDWVCATEPRAKRPCSAHAGQRLVAFCLDTFWEGEWWKFRWFPFNNASLLEKGKRNLILCETSAVHTQGHSCHRRCIRCPSTSTPSGVRIPWTDPMSGGWQNPICCK